MTATLQVHTLAHTWFDAEQAEELTGWRTDGAGGQALAEFAGRACYQSWSKPNPATATNAGYLAHILDVGHLSVLEHGSATFYLTGVSRSLTHELVRHRHLSYSQLSQRYVDGSNAEYVVPPLFDDDEAALHLLSLARDHNQMHYEELVERGTQLLAARPDLTPTARRKQARQAARAVLPNATETRIVVTGNYRAWRHFIGMRATEHADVEIRAAAVAILRELLKIAGNVFDDFAIITLADGTEVGVSTLGASG